MFWIKYLKICYESVFKDTKSASNSKKSYDGILTKNFDQILCWFYYKICFIFQNKTNLQAWSALYIKFIQLIFSFLQFATKWSKKTEFKRIFAKLVKILWFWTFSLLTALISREKLPKKLVKMLGICTFLVVDNFDFARKL